MHSGDMPSTSASSIDERLSENTGTTVPSGGTPSTSSLPIEEKDAKTSIEEKLSSLFSSGYQHKSFLPVSIHKVPQKLQKASPDSFLPRIVSIGPNHRRLPLVKPMEVVKLRCLARFKRKYNDALTNIIKEITEREAEIRNCYEEPIPDIKKEEFIEMITMDSIFILELLSEISIGAKERRDKTISVDEKIFDQKWMVNEILRDMLIMENQLPWFVISICHWHATSKAKRKGNPLKVEMYFDAFLDLLEDVTYHFQGVGIACTPEIILAQNTYCHFLEILWQSLLPTTRLKRPRRRGKPEYTRTATELYEAGITFNNGQGQGRATTDIEFSFSDGELTIPTLCVNEWTETLFRNLIALEQRKQGLKHSVVTSYIVFMDYLIDTSADVDLLKRKRILDCSGNSQDVADLFNRLHKETFLENKGFYFARQCEELNDYRKDIVHAAYAKLLKWMRMLFSDQYFGNPWGVVAIVASIVLLVASVMQTVLTFIQTLNKK